MKTENNYGAVSGSPITDILNRIEVCTKWAGCTSGAEQAYWAAERDHATVNLLAEERRLADDDEHLDVPVNPGPRSRGGMSVGMFLDMVLPSMEGYGPDGELLEEFR